VSPSDGGRAPESPPAPRTAREVLERGRTFLERKGVEEWRLDAELLVAFALGLDRLRLFLELECPVSPEELDRARQLLVRRASGVPTAYLTGQREFYGRPFRVGPGVLVPRPETELLVDLARERLAAQGDDGERTAAPRLAELGTGSGCIAVTMALEVEGLEVSAVELSPAALEFARANAEALGAEVRFLEGDGLAPLAAHGPFDVLLSNPPYVDRASAGALQREVVAHEPPEALFAPDGDPDHWVRVLVREGPGLVTPGGTVLVELGADQGARALDLARGAGLDGRLHEDLAGIERVLELRATTRSSESP